MFFVYKLQSPVIYTITGIPDDTYNIKNEPIYKLNELKLFKESGGCLHTSSADNFFWRNR